LDENIHRNFRGCPLSQEVSISQPPWEEEECAFAFPISQPTCEEENAPIQEPFPISQPPWEEENAPNQEPFPQPPWKEENSQP